MSSEVSSRSVLLHEEIKGVTVGMVEWTKLEPREKITSRTLQNDNIFLTIPR